MRTDPKLAEIYLKAAEMVASGYAAFAPAAIWYASGSRTPNLQPARRALGQFIETFGAMYMDKRGEKVLALCLAAAQCGDNGEGK